MATTTYYPNDAGCGGYKGTPYRHDLVPGLLATWESESPLSGPNENALSNDNAAYVRVENEGPPPFDVGGICAYYGVVETPTQLDVIVKMEDSGSEDTEIWIYNHNSGAFVSKGTHTGGAPGGYTYSFSIAVNPEYYRRGGDGQVHVLVTSTENDARGCEVKDMKLVVTHSGTTYYELDLGTDVDVETAIVVELMGYLDDVGTPVLVITSVSDIQAYVDADGTNVLVATGLDTEVMAYLEIGSGTPVLVVTGVTEGILEAQGTDVLVVTGLPTELFSPVEHGGTEVLVIMGITDVTTYDAEAVGTDVLVETGLWDDKLYVEDRGTTVLVITGPPGDIQIYYEVGLGTIVQVLTDVLEIVLDLDLEVLVLVETGITAELHLLPIFLSIPRNPIRQLEWEGVALGADQLFLLVIDGEPHVGPTTNRSATLVREHAIREHLLLVAIPMGADPAVTAALCASPEDRVLAGWTDVGADHYILERDQTAGGDDDDNLVAYASELMDGPLGDGDYNYTVVAYDREGDSTPSDTEPVTISAPPEPPANIAYVWDSGASTLTVFWDTSPSGDVVSYRVYSSAGEDRLLLGSGLIQDSASTSCVLHLAGLTGTYIVLVHAVDSAGNEEGGLAQAIVVDIATGVLVSRIADPRFVDATSSAEGKVTVDWYYFPEEEVGLSTTGMAHEARIYYDNGTGLVDLDTPLATVAMGYPTAGASYDWESVALTDDQEYLFVVRIGTDAWPLGSESKNTDEHAATPNSDVPSAPVLTVEVI